MIRTSKILYFPGVYLGGYSNYYMIKEMAKIKKL